MQLHPPAALFYFKDFAGDNIVEAMTTEEVGAFMLLLCKAWYEDPVGTIPDDDRILARWTRLTVERWQECRAGVLAAFKLGDDGRFHQTRLKAEYAKQLAYKEERSKAGKHGADVKKLRNTHNTQTPQTNEAKPKLSLSSACSEHEAKPSFPYPYPIPSPTNRIESSDGSVRLERDACNPGPYAEFLKAKLGPKNNNDNRFLNRVGRAVDGGLISEQDVAGALVGCDGPQVTRPIGMFTSALRKNVQSAGSELESLLASLEQGGCDV